MTTRHVLRLTVAVGVAALLCPPLATAQPPEGGRQRERGQFGHRGDRGQRGGQFGQRGGRRGRGGANITSIALLGVDKIREELKIDEGQAATIDAAIEAFQEERRESRPDRESFRDLSDEERDAMREKLQAEQQKLTSKTEEMIAVLLQPEQNTRLNELVVQLRMKTNPIGTLKTDEMKAALDISEDQLAQIDAAENAMQDAMREVFSPENGERPDRTQMREKMEDLNRKFSEQVVSLLTEDQSGQLHALQGEDLEIDLQAIQGNRRGRGGFGGRGGDRGGNRRRARPPAEDDAA